MSAPQTTLFVVTSLHGGGAEWVARQWMEWLVGRGQIVLVAITSDKPTDGHLIAGTRVLRLGRLRTHGAKVCRLRRALVEDRPDAVVSLQMYPNLIAIAAARSLPAADRPPVVASEHNLVSFGLPGSSVNHRFKTRLARIAYPLADHLIAVSHAVAGEMVGGFGVSEGRCTVVPNPVSAKVSDDLPPRTVADVDIDLVLAHRLVAQKRPRRAVEVAAELQRRGRTVRLTVFGTGPLEDELRVAAAAAGVRLDLRGWVEPWFAACSDRAVLLLASHREGFGNVLVEAAGAGIPSVALSSALGVADAVVPGITGELAPADDVGAIADAVERAAAIEIGEIGAWLARFSTASSGRELERVIAVARSRRR